MKSGHPRFYELTAHEADLHDRKNRDYTGGAGDPLGNFNRCAKIMNLYPGFPIHSPAGMAAAFLLKQFDAVMWAMSQGHETKIESVADRLGDISVYAKLWRIILEEDASFGQTAKGAAPLAPTPGAAYAEAQPATAPGGRPAPWSVGLETVSGRAQDPKAAFEISKTEFWSAT